MNINNLKTLADYLAALPADYTHFDMGHWHTGEKETDPPTTRCGTVACAAGHGPAAGILPLDNHILVDDSIDWFAYTEDLFELDFESREHVWCFGGGWSLHDNTPQGAAKRIRYLIHHGRPPRGFHHASDAWISDYAAY